MKRTRLRSLIASVLALFLVVGSGSLANTTHANGVTDWNMDAAILIEASTGKVLYEDNPDALLGIASMTKMMTEYLLLEAIAEGSVSWDDKYTVTNKTYEISQDLTLSNVPLQNGEAYSIHELYEAMVIKSANAAAIAIAETIAGSEANFVMMMNEKAEELGLEDFNFVNSSGLNNEDMHGYHPEGTGLFDDSEMSARATAKLAQHLLIDFPEVLDTASIPNKVFREGTDAIYMTNTNFMLSSLEFEYEGADGLKTGMTDFAGYTFTGTAIRNDMRLISVVLNVTDDDGLGSANARFGATTDLLNFGFNNFTLEDIIPENVTIEDQEMVAVDEEKEETLVTTESEEKENGFVLSMRTVGGFFGKLYETTVSTVKGWF
ncbi:D-alanyl-D-alanine carboxypeptidase family protein [Jeotgalibacillus marinus]|uniref:D-alanyl-D-alanine carboxypeptidase family protein n=1 Tax=Jeotgalibacillus marinus TaxID=86667 RepID=A0ABV3Q7G8_9BACL